MSREQSSRHRAASRSERRTERAYANEPNKYAPVNRNRNKQRNTKNRRQSSSRAHRCDSSSCRAHARGPLCNREREREEARGPRREAARGPASRSLSTCQIRRRVRTRAGAGNACSARPPRRNPFTKRSEAQSLFETLLVTRTTRTEDKSAAAEEHKSAENARAAPEIVTD